MVFFAMTVHMDPTPHLWMLLDFSALLAVLVLAPRQVADADSD
jgi:hypothetical protein